jgi:uncharacterized protein
MSVEPTSQRESPPAWPILEVHERRVLGVLVEKAKTTPDSYPLTLNALTTASNQKSNRDPILDLNDLDVEEALAACQKKNLVFKITGSRVDRWKHNLYDAWKVNKVELAILGELLLRGAQTEGELRARASRMEPIADLDALRTALKSLASRGLVVYLTAEGRRGTTLTHGLHLPQELERLRAKHPADDHGAAIPSSPSTAPAAEIPHSQVVEQPGHSNLQTQVDALQAEVAALRGQLTELQSTVVTLGNQLRGLKDALGA